MISLQRYFNLALMALMITAFAIGCGTGTRQNPVSSDSADRGEEVGELSEDYGVEEETASEENAFASDEEAEDSGDFDAVEEKTFSENYTVQAGDSLSSIAGMEEIYSDTQLWPILQEANRGVLGDGQQVNVGTELRIPRRLTSEEMDEAREKARQINASASGSIKPTKEKIEEAAEVVNEEPIQEMAAPAPEMEAPAAASEPKPKKNNVMAILIVIFVVLLGAALILLYFMKKDNEEEDV